MVSTGGQESQLFLTRGTWLAKRLGLSRFRSDILPITVGFPFGLSAVVPFNIPLPTKIVTQVLAPMDIAAQFGDDPDIEAVDAHVGVICNRSGLASLESAGYPCWAGRRPRHAARCESR